VIENGNHKNLKVWEKAIDLAEEIYKITKEFPKEELYGIISQIRRAAVSISANIAEGAARNSNTKPQMVANGIIRNKYCLK